MPLGIDFAQVLLHFLNVVILFVGLYVLLYAPVKKFMDDRAAQYKKRDEKSREKLAEAEKIKAEYEEKLRRAEEEIAAQRKTAAEEIAADRKQVQETAKAEAKQIVEDAKRSATDQRLKIVRSAKEDITRMIEEATRKVMDGDNSGDPYEDFLREMERKA